MKLVWKHFEADSECDEFWASEIRLFKELAIEVHVGKSRNTGKFDYQILSQGREMLVKTGFKTRASAELALRSAVITILRNAVRLLEASILAP
jgi:hypothetical protein